MTDQPERIRVLHVLGPLRPSGMERMLVSASPYFKANGIESVIVGQGSDHSYLGELEASGYVVHTIPRIRAWSSTRPLVDLIRSERADVVHIHTEANYLITVLASTRAIRNRTIVRTVHSVFDANGLWRFKRTLQAILGDRFVRSVVAPSPDVADLERRFARRPLVILNWVDDRFYGLNLSRSQYRREPNLAPLMLIVGNCSPIKRHEIALEAALVAGHDVIHIGNEATASPAELAALGRLQEEGRLRDRGPKDPDEALVQCSYFAMPSEREGMGVALAEAMVVGVPALISNSPGFSWATSSPGVNVIEDSEWGQTLATWSDAEARAGVSALIDLSAGRGAREYASVYRRLAGKLSTRRVRAQSLGDS